MNISHDILLAPGTLAGAVAERVRAALRSGALQPIQTDQTLIEDAGVRFVVRAVSSLRRKEAEKRLRAGAGDQGTKAPNPFLPPEPELTVTAVSRTHLAVLNKFNVLAGHLLLVTRAFEHQENLLTLGDFRALFVCMAEYEALGFYNGGAEAGASQTHKHLQLVSLPTNPTGPALPMEPLLTGSGPRCPALPFAHGFARLDVGIRRDPLAAAAEALRHYRRLLSQLGLASRPKDDGGRQSAPYNLLVAHDWMLVVPRVRECYRSISINALGFAGSLFVKEPEQLEIIRSAGPMRVLTAVAGAAV
jgi:sulfate adenylyltransferase (ADP) / ATP adenylyltransferase